MTRVAARYTRGATATIERVFKAPVAKVWAMWTTKAGLEKWYWPEPLVAEVRRLDVSVGGGYEIAAEGLAHTSRGTYVEVREPELLVIVARIDFIADVDGYDRTDVVEFFAASDGAETRMVFTSTKMHSDHWQHMATVGFVSSLDKLERALAVKA